VLNLFFEELEGAKNEFENMKNSASIPFIHGKYSGQSLIVRQLVHRIETLKQSIDKLNFVDPAIKKKSMESYEDV
jgi:hypothetical protein